MYSLIIQEYGQNTEGHICPNSTLSKYGRIQRIFGTFQNTAKYNTEYNRIQMIGNCTKSDKKLYPSREHCLCPARLLPWPPRVADYQRCGRSSVDTAQTNEDEDPLCERHSGGILRRHELGAAHAGPGQAGLDVASRHQPHIGADRRAADRGRINDQRLRVGR